MANPSLAAQIAHRAAELMEQRGWDLEFAVWKAANAIVVNISKLADALVEDIDPSRTAAEVIAALKAVR
jgi:hypothetical protein